jgi:TusA-related sulfurtransferase
MSATFKNPRYECFVRAATGLFKKAFEEEGKLPFSKEKTLEITSRIKNKRMPEFFQKMGMPQPVFEERKPKELKREKMDLRGLECPEPVFRTQEKIWEMEGGIIEVLLDNEQAKHNVSKTAEREGWGVEVKVEGDGEYLLVLAKT